MARLSQEKINEIRQSVDIVDVIGQYLALEKKGRNYMAVCPFHDDTHPSMYDIFKYSCKNVKTFPPV